ncbi:MAG TPA: TylF/MycF/NovP-related O-methyltransferase [Rhodoblastus sp.]|nr:TylF/MycF/NovP-related O-methyltransferase [Rhodoblastus sp.]
MRERQRQHHPEIEDEDFWRFYEASKDYSLVHVAGFYNVFQSINYIARNGVRGCAIESGCFLGGIAIFIGLMRRHLQLDLPIILLDTFCGPPVGTADTFLGRAIRTIKPLPNYELTIKQHITRQLGSLDGYTFVKGEVETTIPALEVGDVALLRLDTDFYSSTSTALNYLYPKLVAGGVLIVDDYGTFKGARTATEDYLATLERKPLLNRIDTGVWAGVKP